MPTAITGSEGGKLNYLPDKMEARMILANLKTQITGQNGVVKPGVLKLMHTTPGSPGNMTFERKRWWQFWARRDSKMVPTTNYLKTLFRRAYGESKNYNSDEKFDSLMAEFDRYLEQRNNRAGTRTLLNFITRFQNNFPDDYEKFFLPPAQDLTAPWKDKFKKILVDDLDSFVFKNIAVLANPLGNLEKPSDQRTKSERLTSNICNAIALPDGRDPEVKPLGSGDFGAVYSFIGKDGERQVIKLMFPEVKCDIGPEASVRGREVCAARLKAERHIIQPDFYLIKRKGGTIFKLPPEAVKGFLRAQKHDCNIIGLIMPMCSGTALNDRGRTLGHSEWKAIAKQTLESLTSLANRGFIHGDIKPDNILFDSEKRDMNLIDTGFMRKMKRNGNGRHLASGICGTPLYFHPRIIRNQPYGCEVDLFSLAFMMLDVRFPATTAALNKARMGTGTYTNQNGTTRRGYIVPEHCDKSWETPDGGYLKNIISIALNRPKNSAELEDFSGSASSALIKMSNALSEAKGEDGEFLSFINSAINTSFASQEDYQERLEELSHHPFLQESTS